MGAGGAKKHGGVVLCAAQTGLSPVTRQKDQVRQEQARELERVEGEGKEIKTLLVYCSDTLGDPPVLPSPPATRPNTSTNKKQSVRAPSDLCANANACYKNDIIVSHHLFTQNGM